LHGTLNVCDEGGRGIEEVTLTTAEHEGRVAYLRSKFATQGWTLRADQLDALAGVLPTTGGPDLSVVAGPKAAFLFGGTLVVAEWDDAYTRLTTRLLHLERVPVTVHWNAEWLADFDARAEGRVPEDRPVTIELSDPNGETIVLPYDESWSNPTACIQFSTSLLARAHGLRPGIDADQDAAQHRTWKR
jgi:hypothetical protein